MIFIDENYFVFVYATITKLGCTYYSSHLGKLQFLVLGKERTNYNGNKQN